MPPVAVTGATGFIGSAVVRQLVAQGRSVRAVIEPGASTRAIDDVAGVDRVVADVCDARRMRLALSGCESLFHLAAVYRLWVPHPEVIYRVNVEGTTTTLLAARAAGVRRVVHTSSVATVGLREGGQSADETHDFNLWSIANDYMVSKHLSERIALQMADAGLPVVVVNPGLPFGPRDHAPTPTGKLVVEVMRGEIPGVTDGGFSLIDVDDCAAGHLLAEEKGRVGERYLLVSHNVTFRAFVEQVAEVAGVKAPALRVPDRVSSALALAHELVADHVTRREPRATYRSIRYLQRLAYFDGSKARTELGVPTRPLRETVERAVGFFQAAGVA